MLTISELRQFRIGPYTIFDTLLAYLGMVLISPILNKTMQFINLKTSLITWLLLTLPLALLFHLVFKQSTPMTLALTNLNGDLFIKTIFIAMLIGGLASIKH